MNSPNPGTTVPAIAVAILALAVPAGLASAAGGAPGDRHAGPAGSPGARPDPAAYVDDQVIVKRRGKPNPRTVAVPDGSNVRSAVRKLRGRPGVAYAAPNYIASVSGWVPNDPGRAPHRIGREFKWQKKQWNFLPCGRYCGRRARPGVRQSPGGIDAVRAWRNLRRKHHGGAAGVKIAVLDTGIAYRKWRRYRRSPDFSARQFLPGRDFVSGNRRPLDRHGHGTHVTGTIAERTNNALGMTGLAYRARIIPVRVLNRYGLGTAANVARGIRYATRRGARVISMSFNFPCKAKVPPVDEAIAAAHAAGVVMVGSIGNRGSEECASAPGNRADVIGVAASTEGGCRAAYSLEGPGIDLAAPGGGRSVEGCAFDGHRPILQVTLMGGDPSRFGVPTDYVGTSMAAAHVSAAAAMVISSGVLGRRPTPDAIEQRLADTARPPLYADGRADPGLGAGIIDIGRATAPSRG